MVQTSGVESHNSIGSCERYDTPLQRIFNKIKHNSPKMDRNIVLCIAFKAMNDNMGHNGLVPSYLVFGCVPRFPSVDSKLPEHQSRMEALPRALQEMITVASELRVQKALACRVPRYAELKIELGDKIRIYCRTDKKYVGQYTVIRVNQ